MIRWRLYNHIQSENYSTIFIHLDNNTNIHCLKVFLKQIQTFDYQTIVSKSGEENKNINSSVIIWEKLSNNNGDRKSLIINLGGGVITDLGGFVASCFKRGIAFINIPLYGGGGETFTGKTVLYETSNIIEIYIQSKLIENGNVNPWNGGNAAVAIQGVGEAVVPPCRNSLDDNWEATNEAWRFVPSGAAIAPTSVNWFDSSGNLVGSGETITVSAPADTYLAQANYAGLCGNPLGFQLSDFIDVTKSEKIWTGATNNNWYEPTNWNPAAIPTSVDCVTIPVTGNDPIADISNLPIPLPPTTAYALNLTVDLGANLRVLSGTNLVVTDYLNN